jgi:hypothetical protein
MNTSYSADTFKAMFDALPLPVFVVDRHVLVHDFNTAAAAFLLRHMADLDGNSYPVQADLNVAGVSPVWWRALFSRDAFIGKAVAEAVEGHCVVRRYTKLEDQRKGYRAELETRIQCCPFRDEGQTLVLLSFEAVRQAAQRKEVIRVCCVCHKLIDATQVLGQLEACARECSGVDFSHGLCPRCYRVEMAKAEAVSAGKSPIRIVKNADCADHDRHRHCR